MSKQVTLLAGFLIFAGCAVQTKMPAKPCPGKMTADEAIAALNILREKITPLRASGQCLLQYYLNDKQHKENFPVKIWANPPAEMYLQGDVAFDATGMVLGSNADEFWFWLKPKEISSFWWGKWSQADQWENFALSPQVLLEAFGAIDIPVGDWSLTHGRYDILWLHNDQGVLLKRVFIEPCDYVVAKIEYFDSVGQISAAAEFSGHKKVADGFFVPNNIKIIAPADDGKENSALFSLASVNPAQLTEQQRQRLFVRPKPRGFEHIYQVVNGKAVEQTSE